MANCGLKCHNIDKINIMLASLRYCHVHMHVSASSNLRR